MIRFLAEDPGGAWKKLPGWEEKPSSLELIFDPGDMSGLDIAKALSRALDQVPVLKSSAVFIQSENLEDLESKVDGVVGFRKDGEGLFFLDIPVTGICKRRKV